MESSSSDKGSRPFQGVQGAEPEVCWRRRKHQPCRGCMSLKLCLRPYDKLRSKYRLFTTCWWGGEAHKFLPCLSLQTCQDWWTLKEGSTLEARGSYRRSQNQEAPSLELGPSLASDHCPSSETPRHLRTQFAVEVIGMDCSPAYRWADWGLRENKTFPKRWGWWGQQSQVRPSHTKPAFQEGHMAGQTLK